MLHVVDAGSLVDDPLGGTQGAVGERVAAAGLVRQFDPLAAGSENHGVIPDDVAAAERVDTNLTVGAFAGDAAASVPQFLLELNLSDVSQYLQESVGRAAGGVLLEAVMHLDDFEVKSGPENFSGFASEPEERVDARRVV